VFFVYRRSPSASELTQVAYRSIMEKRCFRDFRKNSNIALFYRTFKEFFNYFHNHSLESCNFVLLS
jgi:hypothetical protein